MKNAKLVAGIVTAVCSVTAQAQSVEVYGLVGAYAGNIKRSGDAASVRQLGGGGLTTSYLGFRGREELGDGLKVVYALESFFRPDTGEQGRSAADPLFSRNAWVGVEGALGRLSAGRQTNPTYGVMSQLSPFGSSVVFSPLALQSFVAAYGSNILGDSVWNNVVQYSPPSLAGLRTTVSYGLGEVAGRSGVANLGLHGVYATGRLLAAVSAQRLRMNGATLLAVEQTAVLAGATYDFGTAKVFGNAVHTDIERGRHTRTWDVGLSVPVSPAGALLAEAARSRIMAPAMADLYRTTASLGYDYRLSKRTDVYVVYSWDKRSNAASAETQAVGIRHLF